MGKATVTTTIDRVTVGEPIDAAKFAPPPAVTKLAKQPPQDEGAAFQVVERPAQPVASIRTKVKVAEISTQLGIMLPEVGKQLMAAGAKGMGAPFARYHSIEDGLVDLEAGISVQQPIQEKGRVRNSELPGGKCVSFWHVGPYDKLSGARDALLAHLASNKLTLRGGTWDVFWTDPGMVPDPKKWKTQLLAPIE
jgi:effector-binding domain-containing protein